MKILIVSDFYLPHIGGITRFVQRISEKLANLGHDVAIIVPSDKKFAYIKKVDKVTIFNTKSIPALIYPNAYLSLPGQKKYITELVTRFRPDIIHIHSYLVLGYTALKVAKQLNIKVVVTNHVMSENIIAKIPIQGLVNNRIEMLIWKIISNLLLKFDAITTPSKFGALYLKSKNINNKINVISNGIDQSIFKKHKLIDKQIINKYNLPETGIKLFFIGRLDKEKNIKSIIYAMKFLKNKIDVHLILAGIGDQVKEIKKEIKKYNLENNIHFSGFIESKDLPIVYNYMDIFIILSTAELQSIATLEAMSSGLPIIAANAGALPEIVIDKYNGYLVNPMSYVTVKKAIMKLATNKNLRKIMGDRSQKIAKKHDLNKSALEFIKLYKSVIKSDN